jgi:uncharacterized Zn finger protein (UPF0148 family)
MNTTCPSCGCACVARGGSSAVRRVRCRTCGAMVVIAVTTDEAAMERQSHAVVERRASVVLSLTRTDRSASGTRTLLLLADGTTELRAGDETDALLVVGHAARATVSAWKSLAASPTLAALADAPAPNDDDCQYDLRIADARHLWSGKPNAPAATRVFSMLVGLWGTVAQTPF